MSTTEHKEHVHMQEGYADLVAHAHQRPSELPEPAAHPAPPAWLAKWEAKRPRWLIEMIAEAMGVFAYCIIGMGCTASFVFTTAAKIPGEGDLLTIGLGYGIAIIFGILIAAPISGGHLSPGYTIVFAALGAFPWRKVPRYIFAQICGGFVATLFIYSIYKQQFDQYHAELKLLGPAGEALIFTPSGPAGILAIFPSPGQHLGNVWWTEWVANSFLAIVVLVILDPSNFLVSLPVGPVIIGVGYSACIWAFAANTIALNTARDLGGRMGCAVVYGPGCFPTKYSAIAALTNIPATLFAGLVYTVFLKDGGRPVVNPTPAGHPLAMEARRNAARKESVAASDLERASSAEK